MKRQPARSLLTRSNLAVIGLLLVTLVVAWAFVSSSSSSSLASPALKASSDDDDDSKVDHAPRINEQVDGTFLYFAYASDLVEARLRAGGGPSAELVAIGQVEGMRFAYSQESKVWRGGVADIVKDDTDASSAVWGVVYRLQDADLASLDKQKGVGKADPLYERIRVRVKLNDGDQTVDCTSYAMVPARRSTLAAGLPPSIQYRKCILQGAKQAKLPKTYQNWLKRIQDNGNTYERRGVTCGG